MKKGQKQSEEAKDKIRKARLKTDENGYSLWNDRIKYSMTMYWKKKKFEEKASNFDKDYTDLG